MERRFQWLTFEAGDLKADEIQSFFDQEISTLRKNPETAARFGIDDETADRELVIVRPDQDGFVETVGGAIVVGVAIGLLTDLARHLIERLRERYGKEAIGKEIEQQEDGADDESS